MSSVLQGFESIFRYWDSSKKTFSVKIKPGEFYVANTDEPISTTLGSCIAVCIRDPFKGYGGVNHFMLPDTGGGSSPSIGTSSVRYGSFAMEHLINTLLSYGAKKSSLEIKVFGGARIISGGYGVGKRNITFIKSYLQKEELNVSSEDLGGTKARRIIYFPVSGRVLVRKLESEISRASLAEEKQYMDEFSSHPINQGEIELF